MYKDYSTRINRTKKGNFFTTTFKTILFLFLCCFFCLQFVHSEFNIKHIKQQQTHLPEAVLFVVGDFHYFSIILSLILLCFFYCFFFCIRLRIVDSTVCCFFITKNKKSSIFATRNNNLNNLFIRFIIIIYLLAFIMYSFLFLFCIYVDSS